MSLYCYEVSISSWNCPTYYYYTIKYKKNTKCLLNYLLQKKRHQILIYHGLGHFFAEFVYFVKKLKKFYCCCFCFKGFSRFWLLRLRTILITFLVKWKTFIIIIWGHFLSFNDKEIVLLTNQLVIMSKNIKIHILTLWNSLISTLWSIKLYIFWYFKHICTHFATKAVKYIVSMRLS